MNKKLISLLIAASLTLGASQAFASPYNATIPDYLAGAGFGGGPFGVGGEDNETEPGTIASQVWDMEAFVVDGTSLYIVGGYNMQAGAAGAGGSVVPGMLTPGDLFIKVGGGNPTPAPIAAGSGPTVTNAGYGYSFAVDLTQPVGATGVLASVYSLTAASVFNTVVYDQFQANPWSYNSGGSLASVRAISYTSGLANGSAPLVALGLGGLTGGSHNILQVDLGFLSVAAGTPVWFSYTMECGNDSLKGSYSGGFDRVPDGSASAVLIGLGLAAMSFFGLKRRR